MELHRFFARLGAYLRPERAERTLSREVAAHLALLEEHYRGAGLSEAAARLAACRDLDVESIKSQQRDARSFPWFEDLRQDLRHAARALARTPGFTAVAVITLALGIGANSAIFSLINAALLKPLPYRDPDRLVMIWAVHPDHPEQHSRATGPEFVAWQREASAFEVIATEGGRQGDLGAGDRGEPVMRVSIQRLQAELFDALGVGSILGRQFRLDEERVGAAAPVVMLSERLWERRFNRDPNILNTTVRLDGQPVTIVGVMPASFTYITPASSIDLYAPFAFNPTQVRGSGRGYTAVARLKPGVTIRQAQADMDAVMARIAPELPAPSRGFGALVEPLHQALYGSSASSLFLLEGIVALVLLIACANVAGLFVARSFSRSTEIAVRSALGAGRLRIVRQLLTESALLSVLGGVVGIGVAAVMLRLLTTYNVGWIPRIDEVAIDGRVLVFTFLTSVMTGLLFGCVPAFHASKVDLIESMKASSRGTTGTFARQRIRSGLVVVQVAFAVILLVGAGLVVSSFVRLKTNDIGADPRGVIGFTVPFQGARYSETVGPYRGLNLIEIKPLVADSVTRLWTQLQALPGVQAVAGTSAPPFLGGGPLLSFTIDGRPAATSADRDAMSAAYQVVTPGYFATLRIPTILGRDFDARDAFNTPWGVVINEAMARQFWPGVSPIGQRLTLDLVADERPREVIGVVRNARSSPYEISVAPVMYGLYTQQAPHTLGPIGTPTRNTMTFVVRTSVSTATAIAGIRRVMTAFDRDRPMVEVRRLEESLTMATENHRYAASLFGVLSLLAVLLAGTGIYGIVSYGVVQRTREIGIRMALGGRRSTIRLLILREILLITGIGVGLGLGGALLLTGAIRGLLFGVAPTDPLTYALVVLVMVVAVVLAAWIPSERAARLAPTIALRSE